MPWFQHTGRVFEIYSIGDGLYMQRILNSVASLSNAGLLIQLFALSMILGLIIMGVKNVMAGGNKLDLGTTFVSFFLGVFMFGMTADVAVYDMSYSPGERIQGDFTVSNVPFGIAMAGWLISGVGYNLTEEMEKGFSVPGMEDMRLYSGGFGKTLEWISALRTWEVPVMALPNGEGRAVEVWKKNLATYLTECTIPGIELGHIKHDRILNAQDPLTKHESGGGIGYDSLYLMTEIESVDGSVTTDTCDASFAALQSQRVSAYDGFTKAISFNVIENGGTKGSRQTLEDAFRVIGYSQEDTMKLALSASVGTSMQFALENAKAQQSLSTVNQIMIEQASAQRAVQWAAEETMFRRIMRPMMAFFESLLYALAPFMALAVGLGAFGIQTVFKYMMLAIWVALWMPMLSIIQLYQITAMQNAVAGMLYGMDGLAMNKTSIAAAELVRSQSMEWLASGAALAAWTPAITMALVWSGSITASALAGKMQGQDTVNEKLSSPDATNTPSAVTHGGLSNWDSIQGTQRVGSTGTLDNLTLKTSNSSSLNRSSALVDDAARSYTAAMNRAIQHSTESGQNWDRTREMYEQGMVQFGRSGQVTQTPKDFMAGLTNSSQYSQQQQTAIRSALQASMGADGRVDAGKFAQALGASANAGVKGIISDEAMSSKTAAFQLLSDIAQRSGISLQMSDSWQNSLIQGARSGAKVAQTGAEKDIASQDARVGESYDRLQRATDSFTAARQSGRSADVSRTFTPEVIMGLLDQAGSGNTPDADLARNKAGAIVAAAQASIGSLSSEQRRNADVAMNGDRAIARSNYRSSEQADLYVAAKYLMGGYDTAIGGDLSQSSNNRAQSFEEAWSGGAIAGSFHGAAPRAASATGGNFEADLPSIVDQKRDEIGARIDSKTRQTDALARAAPSIQSVGGLLSSAADPHGQADAHYEHVDGEIKAKELREHAEQIDHTIATNPNQQHMAAEWSKTFGEDSRAMGAALLRVGNDGQVYFAQQQGFAPEGAAPPPGERLVPYKNANVNQTSAEFNQVRDRLIEEGQGREQATFSAAALTKAEWGTNEWFAGAAAVQGKDQATRDLWMSRTSDYSNSGLRRAVDAVRHQADVEESSAGPGADPIKYDLRGRDGGN